jgi:hypothetical protein
VTDELHIPEDAGKDPSGLPGWAAILTGLAAAALIGGAAWWLYQQYMATRPMNLLSHAEVLSEEVAKVLGDHGIAEGAVRVTTSRPMEDSRARWRVLTVDARLGDDGPTAPGLAEAITRRLQPYGARVTGVEPPEDAAEALAVAFKGKELVRVALYAPHAEQPPADEPVEAARAPGEPDAPYSAALLASQVADALSRAGAVYGVPLARAPLSRRADGVAWSTHRMRAALAPGQTAEAARIALANALAPSGAEVELVRAPEGDASLVVEVDGREYVEVGLNAPPPDASALPPLEALPMETGADEPEPAASADTPKKPARVAIVVDDGGYGGSATEAILALDPRLTLAILPFTPHAADTAERAAALGYEVILHMPMEADTPSAAFPGMLRTDMDAAAIREATRAALATVPGAAGVNSHTGSVFTTHPDALTPFLDVLREEGLYFVDSRTTAETVAYSTAEAMGIPALERRVFLDNEATADGFRAAMERLIAIARTEGGAVGICHFRATSAEHLAASLPLLEEKNAVLVHASELLP